MLIADYTRLYGGRSESGAELRARALERFLTNPSLHAVLMMRAALAGPAALMGAWRQLLLAMHSIDLERECSLGPGLVLPHPFGILITSGVEIGADAVLYHNVTIGRVGQELSAAPLIAERVIVHPNAVVLPGAVVGADAVIGANAIVEGDVPEGAVVKRGRVGTASI
jgi:serine O-acetyltransferase